MEITSTSNSRVKEWKKLNTKKGRKKQNKYFLDGLHLVKEALKANK
ncbi:RNA methyltransferase, partial [Ligilactobacillus salivarius]